MQIVPQTRLGRARAHARNGLRWLACTTWLTCSCTLAHDVDEAHEFVPGSVDDRFNVVQGMTAARVRLGPGIEAQGDLASLFDGDSTTSVTFRLPARRTPIRVLELKLRERTEISEIQLEVPERPQYPRRSHLITTATFLADREDLRFSSIPMSEVEAWPTQVTFTTLPSQSPVEEAGQLSLYLEATDASAELTIAEIGVYASPTIDLLHEDARGRVVDVHFHPCSFRHDCASLPTIVAEQTRAGVSAAFAFGLQHNLVRGGSPWAIAAGVHDPRSAPLPFHYADPGARDSRAEGALPGLLQVNAARSRSGLEARPDYPDWPVRPNLLADWSTLTALRDANEITRQRLFAFASSLRLLEGGPGIEYGVCSVSTRGRLRNMELVLALDRLFPDLVRGYAEYNLNKAILFDHASPAPELSETWIDCFAPIMDHLARSGRPIGFHADITADQAGYSGLAKIMELADTFPDTTIIWHHAGIAPEVDPSLSTSDHLEALSEFIETAPDRRFVELSWPRGFFLRLDPDGLGDLEQSSGNALRLRDWPQHFARYAAFIGEHATRVLLGSDQVGLHYPQANSHDLRAEPFVNHLAYLHGQTYAGGLRQELSLLANTLDHASDTQPLSSEQVEALAHTNALELMNRYRPPSLAPSDNEAWALEVLAELAEMQHREIVAIAGTRAPTPAEFMPPDLCSIYPACETE